MKLPRFALRPSCVTALFSILLVGATLVRAADPAALGFDPARLARLDRAIQEQVDQAQLAGGVMLVLRDGQVAHLRAFGQQDLEARTPMKTDAIFRIASMSKAITTVAALILYEEGRFMLNDPVSKFIPEFANSQVAVALPAGATGPGKYTTEKAKSPITIRQLMTHTAGLTYGNFVAADDYKAANLFGWYFADKDETIGDAMKRLGKLPLAHHPGEAFDYGYGTDLLGYLVEVVSGQPLDRFIAERITGPLKMADTSFFLPADKVGRLATVYGIKDGKLVRGDQGHYVDGPRKCFSGGAGLLSTAGDYGRFLQMLLNGGELDGVRVLSPATVALMHENHVGDLFMNGRQGFGLGFFVNDRPGRFGEAIGPGCYGWGSAYFPQYIVDPKERLVVLFMTQHLPAGTNDLNQRMKVLTYQALIK